jgi:hypothetical protein
MQKESTHELSMARKNHRALVDKLIDDKETRAAYEKDPAAVLRQHGVRFDSSQPPQPGKLPDAETLRAFRDAGSSELPIDWDAGPDAFSGPTAAPTKK